MFSPHVRWSELVCSRSRSSHDASETSLDDEQFRARRDFLKSGLPESFKKQIAKTAASREAYTLSCASFQRVEHVLQRPEGNSLLSLLCFSPSISSSEPRSVSNAFLSVYF